MLKCDFFFRENDVFQCSKAACFQHFLRKSLWCTHQKSSSSQVWLLRRRICTQILWKHHVTLFSNFSQNSTLFSINFSVKSTCFFDEFSKNCECFVSTFSDFPQKLPVFLFFFPCLFWNQVSSVLSPPWLLSFTWWTVVAGSHWSYSRESSHRRSTWRGCAHW